MRLFRIRFSNLIKTYLFQVSTYARIYLHSLTIAQDMLLNNLKFTKIYRKFRNCQYMRLVKQIQETGRS